MTTSSVHAGLIQTRTGLYRVCPRLFFLHYSTNWFIFTDHDSRGNTVALRLVVISCCPPYMCEMIGSMCCGSSVGMEIFILFNSHTLFNVPLPACLDWDRPTSCRALCPLKPQHQRFSAQWGEALAGCVESSADMIWWSTAKISKLSHVESSLLMLLNIYSRCVFFVHLFILPISWKCVTIVWHVD